MKICPECGQSVCEENTRCNVEGCINTAIWEGWYQVIDPLTQKPTGLRQLRTVCNAHKYLLEGAENGN
jgi:hypothetical protein